MSSNLRTNLASLFFVFAVRVLTKNGRHYDMTFTTRAGLVWIDKRLLDVPDATATQIVQRVEKVLKRK